MAKWFINMKKADFNGIARKYGVSTVIARIMRNREVRTDEEINLYLNGTPEDLYDGRLMKDMECAVSILKEKIAEEKKIRIIGDYDIDGVNSTYILQKGLELAGADVDTDIPHRIKDGYGLNRALVDRAYQDGVDTILTCDNGIAAIEEIAYGKEKGMTVIVTDHHEVKFKEENGVRIYQIPAADAVIDPHQKDCKKQNFFYIDKIQIVDRQAVISCFSLFFVQKDTYDAKYYSNPHTGNCRKFQ